VGERSESARFSSGQVTGGFIHPMAASVRTPVRQGNRRSVLRSAETGQVLAANCR
jgi:hypothetical protein